MKRRSQDQILSLILAVARADERIRAVLLGGSRSNPKIEKDEFQDYDVIFLVNDLVSFKKDASWIDVFGERIIMQMPNDMRLYPEDELDQSDRLVYLMLFKDFNRIDLTLSRTDRLLEFQDSLNQVLLDKDDLFEQSVQPSDRDYWIRKPGQIEFSDCCNEFWWVSTYVVKGIARKEQLYAKAMLEGPVRTMFMKMIAWYVGTNLDFNLNLGANNRFLQKHLDHRTWEKVLSTYPDANLKNIGNSLLQMTVLFHEFATAVSLKNNIQYNIEEADNTMAYIDNMLKNRIDL